MLDVWIAAWRDVGLGPWIVRARGDDTVLGHAGCSPRDGWWNLGYRFAAEAHGQGLATGPRGRRSRRRCGCATCRSRRVADKLGLALQHRGPDSDNPDPAAVRLVYADRPLTPEQRAATLA